MPIHPKTKAEIDRLISAFFGLFCNQNGMRPDLSRVHDLFVKEGVIARCVAASAEIMTLDQFIGPRVELLSSGTLTDFAERETSETTEVLGHIARRLCTYEKRGVLRGEAFVTRGVKSFQLLETPVGWRILSMAWDDERDGFDIPVDVAMTQP